jgi:hypothetical protein
VRDGAALTEVSNSSAGSDQLAALLRPHPTAAGKDPCRADAAIVGIPAHDGGVAVGGQRDGEALADEGSNSAGADQLRAFLDKLCRCRLGRAKERSQNGKGNSLANFHVPNRPRQPCAR